MKIGLFDSGIGGLSILKEVIKKLPQYDYVYLADNLHVPYGGRSTEEIYNFTRQAVEFLFKQDCDLVIIACNTATTTSLRKIQQKFLPENYPTKKVLGVTRAAMEGALELQPKIIGVIATEATVLSESFPIELHKLHENIPVYQQACPKLVPLIEAENYVEIDTVLHEYLNPLLKKNIDTLILGCTHYGLIREKIQQIVGSHIKIIGEGSETASKLEAYLQRHQDIEKQLSKNGSRVYFATSVDVSYENLFKTILQENIVLNSALL